MTPKQALVSSLSPLSLGLLPMYPLDKTPAKLTKTLLVCFVISMNQSLGWCFGLDLVWINNLALAQESQSTSTEDSNKGTGPRSSHYSLCLHLALTSSCGLSLLTLYFLQDLRVRNFSLSVSLSVFSLNSGSPSDTVGLYLTNVSFKKSQCISILFNTVDLSQ